MTNHHAGTQLPATLYLADEQGWAVAGTSTPNPPVGCVIVDDKGEVVGRGGTQPRAGSGNHAEVEALTMAGERAHGATVYVTLEPCQHTGNTGPCSQALIDAEVSEVHFVFADPGHHSGGGAADLRAAGITVHGPYYDSVDAAQTDRHKFSVEPWLRTFHAGRPTITLKFASTFNGLAAATDRTSQWITGEVARNQVHLDRTHREVIIAGTGTVEADNPQLTARPDGVESTRQPQRLIVGTRELDPAAQIFVATDNATAAEQLKTRDIAEVINHLNSLRVSDVLVEGGPRLAKAFLDAGVVDEIQAYLAPAWLAAGLPAVAQVSGEHTTISEIQRFSTRSVKRLGEDLLWCMTKTAN